MINVSGFNSVPTNEALVNNMKKNAELINANIAKLRELDGEYRTWGATGTTAIVELDGKLVEFDTALATGKNNVTRLRQELGALSSTQLESFLNQFEALRVATEGVNNATRLYKENLASINVEKFNAIPTTNVSPLYSQNISIQRTMASIQQLSDAYKL